MTRFGQRRVALQVHLVVLRGAPQPLDKHVVDPLTLAVHVDGNAVLLERTGELGIGVSVNCAPWSVLKICGRPKRAGASWSASTQKSVVIVLFSSTLREYRSGIATR